MRAVSVLVAILSLAAPPVSWSAFEFAPAASTSISLAAPAVAGSHFLRAAVTADKTFGSTFAITRDAQPLFAPTYTIDGHSLGSDRSPGLDLHGPPLAARPPPLSSSPQHRTT
jgi:hypothetical protein